MKILKLFITLIISILFTYFVFSNTQIVVLNLFFWEIKIRLFLLIIFSFVFGVLFADLFNYFKNFFRIKNYKKKIKNLENKIKD